MVLSPRFRFLLSLTLLASLSVPVALLHAKDDPDGAAPLIKALRDEQALVRKRAVLALTRLGPRARGAIPILQKLREDDDPEVRAAAAAALDVITAPQSLETVVRRLHDRTADSKRRAEDCQLLANHFWREPAASKALEAVLTDPAVKLEAAKALEAIDQHLSEESGPEARRRSKITLVNLKYVVLNYRKFTDFSAAMKQEAQKYQESAQELNNRLEGYKKQLQGTPDEPTREKLEQDSRAVQRDLQDLTDKAKRDLMKSEAEHLARI